MTARRPSLRTTLVASVALVVALVTGVYAWWQWVPSRVDASSVQPAELILGPGADVLVFGDSWTYGSAATLPTRGYAYLLGELTGWNVAVDGVRGSGYLKPGLDGPTYGERIAALPAELHPELIIVQGSINDRAMGARGYRTAVAAAWDGLSARFPSAQIVILGPAPQVLPVQAATRRIDRDLADLAAQRGWWYVSPVRDDWITPQNYAATIDTGIGRNHPSTAGHARLAELLSAALSERTATTDASG